MTPGQRARMKPGLKPGIEPGIEQGQESADTSSGHMERWFPMGISRGRMLVMAPAMGLLAAGLLAGCSGSVSVGGNNLDDAKLEETIKADLAKAAGDSTAITVDCPADVAIKTGATSECTATIGSQTLVYKVEQTDDQGNVTYTRTEAVLDLDKAESVVAGQIAEQVGGEWTMDCKPAGAERLYVIAVDGTFNCDVSGTNKDGDAQTATVVLTVKDLDGNVSWETAQ
jgi:hypothetical protein